MRPRTRAWILSGFLAAHLALTVPLIILAGRWNWPGPAFVLQELNLDGDGSPAALYAGVLWGAVAALAAVQVFRPAVPTRGPRWLCVLGWCSVALFAGAVAFEEIAGLKDALGRTEWVKALLASVRLADLPAEDRWAAVVAPIAAPPAVAAAWVLYASLRHRPALALLTVLAVALGVSAVLHDGLAHLYGTTGPWLLVLDDGSELMAGAILAVVLVELLVAGPTSSTDDRGHRASRVDRWAALAVTLALVGVSIPALSTEYEWEEAGWRRPFFYTGPFVRFETPFQTHLDQLTQIDVWGYVDAGDDKNATTVILVRLIPRGGGPVTETHARMRGHRSNPAVNTIEFEPIPASKDKIFDLVILAESFPWVFLGLTDSGAGPLGGVFVNEVRHERQLAMGTHVRLSGAGIIGDLLTRDPRRLFVVGEVVATLFLWIFAVAATWRGLAGHPPHFWHRYVWPVARRSALITVGLLVIALAETALH